MKKRILVLCLTLLAALLLTGCGIRTVQEMYALPRRSEEFSQLQSAIDTAMAGKTFSAPLYGDNQQTVQMADLDGDGLEEYIIFASDNSDKPLKVLIFAQTGENTIRLVETIAHNGAAFEQVEYVSFDERPGCEMVIGCQVSDQVLRRVSVYSYQNGSAEQMLLVGYSKFQTCDLDQDGRSELMVLRPGEAETQRGMAMLYSFHDGQIERSVETELSEDTSRIRRITPGTLQCGTPAVFVASAVADSAIVTDIFALHEDRFTNISFSSEADTSIRTLRNHYVYAEDIDADGILELPGSITMKALSNLQVDNQNFLLRWFSVDAEGLEMDKLFTYHNYVGGWYMILDNAWATRAMVEERNGVYGFYIWDAEFQQADLVYTLYVFSGNDQDEKATSEGRFALYRTESAAYAVKLEPSADRYHITEDSLINNFHFIRQDWRTDET